jgi:hypothetical protein
VRCEGTYKAKIRVNVLNVTQPFEKRFDFVLSAAEIQRLQLNIQTTTTLLDRHYFPQAEVYEPKWNWINPNTIPFQ